MIFLGGPECPHLNRSMISRASSRARCGADAPLWITAPARARGTKRRKIAALQGPRRISAAFGVRRCFAPLGRSKQSGAEAPHSKIRRCFAALDYCSGQGPGYKAAKNRRTPRPAAMMRRLIRPPIWWPFFCTFVKYVRMSRNIINGSQLFLGPSARTSSHAVGDSLRDSNLESQISNMAPRPHTSIFTGLPIYGDCRHAR